MLSIASVNAGVSIDTVIETPEGSKEIRLLKIGDNVISIDKNFSKKSKSIITIEEICVDSYVEIMTEDEVVIRVSSDQKLFVPQKWLQADQLSLGDVLLKKDYTFIGIKSICLKKEPVRLQFITVEDCKNFFISKNGVLVHNGPISGAIGYWAAKTLCYGTAVAAVGAITVATGSAGGVFINTVAAATTLGASSGATLTAAAITGAGLTPEAATATLAVATSAGGVTQSVAAVETFSTFVGWVCSCLPLP